MKQLRTNLVFLSLVVALSLVISACGNSAVPTAETSDMAMDMSGDNRDDGESMTAMAMDEVPADLNTDTERMTDAGLFNASITSNMMPVDINQIHSWTLHLETPDGQAIVDAEVAIDGGMPQHNHGFPTSPQVTENLGDGDYLVEGVRFNMTGWWEMKFDISANGQSDTITFNVVVETGHDEGAMSDMDHTDDADHDSDQFQLTPGELTVENVVGNLTLPTETGAVYLTILNGTTEDETLLGADIEGCEVTEIHEVMMNNEVMTMRPVEGGQVGIPAGEMVTLKQGGLHLMCIGKTSEFASGDQTTLTLTFAQAGQRAVTVNVKDITELGGNHQGHQ